MPAELVAGLRTRVASCLKHRCDYVQLFVDGADTWAGRCPDCSVDDEIEGRANVLLAQRVDERWARIDSLLAESEKSIQSETDDRMAEEREERRAEWESQVRQEWSLKVAKKVEHEMRREIISELKGVNTDGAN